MNMNETAELLAVGDVAMRVSGEESCKLDINTEAPEQSNNWLRKEPSPPILATCEARAVFFQLTIQPERELNLAASRGSDGKPWEQSGPGSRMDLCFLRIAGESSARLVCRSQGRSTAR